KEPDPSARPHPARLGNEEGPRRDDDPRLQASWHDDTVRGPQRPRRHRHRQQYAAPPAPGVHPLPQRRRNAGAGAPPCLIGMEACVGAHHLSRKLGALGHDARLMPAKYVRPYSKGQKNDFRDAEAIAEAPWIMSRTGRTRLAKSGCARLRCRSGTIVTDNME